MRAIGETGCIIPERPADVLSPQKGRGRMSYCIKMGRDRLGGRKCPGSPSYENEHKPQQRYSKRGVLHSHST